jgi:hypothetical protein
MKKKLLFTLILFCSITLNAQNFTGQWKGTFIDQSTSFNGWGGEKCDYVLELEAKGDKLTGFSYTYFNDGGKRYYTICRLEGFIKKGSKYVELREVERTKTNVPADIRNCFQIHKLSYFKKGNEETLEGNWIPAPNQGGDCGKGITNLGKRILQVNKPLFNNAISRTDKPKTPVTKISPKPKPTTPPIVKTTTPAKPRPVISTPKELPTIAKKEVVSSKPIVPKTDIPFKNFEKRDNSVVQTIEVENETFKVDFYDNGDIDGDTISVFYNGKLIEAHKRLTDKALSLTLLIDPNVSINELIMYAENLGSIPPNTAVMIVTDGGKRYEVRIASDLKKSGVIRFVHKPK